MIKDEIKEVMSSIFMIDVSKISDKTIQSDIENWDSLQHLNLIVALEEKYSINLEPEEIQEMISLEKIIDIITTKFNSVS